MTKTIKTTITPQEASDMIFAATGELISARRLLYWGRHRTAGFPALEMAKHSSLLRFSRADVEAWITANYPEKPSQSAPERAVTRRRAKS